MFLQARIGALWACLGSLPEKIIKRILKGLVFVCSDGKVTNGARVVVLTF